MLPFQRFITDNNSTSILTNVHDHRYTRIDRSRSRSRSPVRRRDSKGHRRPSPRRSRSPVEQHKRDAAYRPQSYRGGGGGPSANRGRSSSRSENRDPLRSRSPDAAPAKRGTSKYNRRHSSSSRSSSSSGSKGGLVSYWDVIIGAGKSGFSTCYTLKHTCSVCWIM